MRQGKKNVSWEHSESKNIQYIKSDGVINNNEYVSTI
jgi:hypothetical protein